MGNVTQCYQSKDQKRFVKIGCMMNANHFLLVSFIKFIWISDTNESLIKKAQSERQVSKYKMKKTHFFKECIIYSKPKGNKV